MIKKELKIKERQVRLGNRPVFKTIGNSEGAIKDMERKSDSEFLIKIKFSPFGNRDSDGDIMIKGAFANSIKQRGPQSDTNAKIVFCWQHDIKDVIGRPLEIWEEQDGAYATIKLSNFRSVPNAMRVWDQLNDGDLNQFSYGYFPVWDKIEYDEKEDAFINYDLHLYELSAVTFGANELTEYMGIVEPDNMKSIKEYGDFLKSSDPGEFEKWREDLRSYFDDDITRQKGASVLAKYGRKLNNI